MKHRKRSNKQNEQEREKDIYSGEREREKGVVEISFLFLTFLVRLSRLKKKTKGS